MVLIKFNVPPVPKDNPSQSPAVCIIEPVGTKLILLAEILPFVSPDKSEVDIVSCVLHIDRRSVHTNQLFHRSPVRKTVNHHAGDDHIFTCVGYCEHENSHAVTFSVIFTIAACTLFIITNTPKSNVITIEAIKTFFFTILLNEE